MISDERDTDKDMHDKTISQLLRHLKQIRQAVPVNYQLKADLKQRLLEQMKQMEAANSVQPKIQAPTPIWKRWMTIGVGVVVVAALAVGITLNDGSTIRLEDFEKISLPNAKSTLEDAAISARGDQLAVLTNENKVYTFSIKDKSQERGFSLPQTSGSYTEVAWSGVGRHIAVIEQTTDAARIWVVDVDQQPHPYGSRLVWEEKKATIHGLSWYPTGEQIAFTREKNGEQAIELISTYSVGAKQVTAGSQPAWSPDGKSLAFTQQGKIMVMNMDTKSMQTIDQGSGPSWISEHELTYISAKQQLEGVSLTEGAQAIQSKQTVHTDPKSVKKASWSLDGRSVLLFANNQTEELTLAKRDE